MSRTASPSTHKPYSLARVCRVWRLGRSTVYWQRLSKPGPAPRRRMVNQALHDLWPDFRAMNARIGGPSIPPEKPLRALLLQVLASIRRERLLMENFGL